MRAANHGIDLALRAAVPEALNPPKHDAPVVLWRMTRADGVHSHAVINPRLNGAVVVWFINGRVLGYRDFGDWTSALHWADRLQAQNWSVGWRPVAD